MRVSIKSFIVGLFLLLIGVSVGQGIFASHSLSTIKSLSDEIADKRAPSLMALQKISAAVGQVRVTQYQLLTGVPEARGAALERLRATETDLAAARAAYEPLMIDAADRANYAAFASDWTEASKDWTEVADRVAAGDVDGALAQFSGDMQGHYDKASKSLTDAVDDTSDDMANTANEGQDEASRASVAVYIALAISVVLSIGVAGLTIARVVFPIGGMTAYMTTLANGDTSGTAPSLARTDEIGAMARAVQVFQDNMIRNAALEAETVATRKAGEAQRKAMMIDLADRFEAAVGGVVALVSSAATELQATAQQLSASAEETSANSQSVSSAAEKAGVSVTTVASSAEELGASVREIGSQVSRSATMAANAVVEANASADVIQELDQATARIGDIVSMISGIAEQTNLLALNATIEAARAGEAGRGFAVVASEVKSLAEQTAKATAEINQQITGIQQSSAQAVSVIRTIGSRISEISDVAIGVAGAVEEQGAATQEIVTAVHHAANGTSDVSSGITGVAQAAQETGAAAAQVLSAASELSVQSERLRGEVSSFLTGVRAA